MTEKEIRDRFTGTLVGLAVGDALGAPVEFMTVEQIRTTHGTLKKMVGGGWLKLKPGEYTDDTTMMLCIAESLILENGEYNPDDIARRFGKWCQSSPKDIGNTTRRALERIAGGIPLKEAGDRVRPSNGSVMRCAPVGLMYFRNEPELIRVSIETSAITHAHAEAVLSCVFTNIMIAKLVGGGTKSSAFTAALAVTIQNKQFITRFSNALMGNRDPGSGLAVDTIVLALESFAEAKSFEETVVKAVNLGGDADTIGAVAGALAGAYWGASAIPKRWSSKLNPYSAQQIKKRGRMLFKLASNRK